MSKGIKVIVIIMLAVIAIYVAVGVDNVKRNQANIEMNSSGDLNQIIDSGENIDELKFHYEVSSGDNELIIRAITSGDIGTTRYIYENDKLVQIVVTEEIISGDFVEEVYNSMKNDPVFVQTYDTITLEGNIITMVLKEEYVNALVGKPKTKLYEELLEAMEN